MDSATSNPSSAAGSPRGSQEARRYELAPLLALSGLSKSALQAHLGVSGREWGRYWAEGVTWKVADRVAGRCGLHPGEVWPDWITAAEDERRLRRNAQERARYQRNKAKRDRRLETERVYREECAEYVREAKRRYRAANREAIAERRKAYVEANRERKREADRARYLRNRDAILAAKREQYRAEREMVG